MKSVCVVIATYNERKNLETLIPELMGLPCDLRLLIVDDSSPDGTSEFVRECSEKIPRVILHQRPKKMGYGPAMTDGLRHACELGTDCVVTMDADFSHNPQDILQFLKELEEVDVVLGSRYVGGIRVLNWAPSRLFLSMGANRYVKTVLGLKFSDCTSGFRGYRSPVLKKTVEKDFQFRGYAFLVELLYRLVKSGARIEEFPIVYTERRQGESKMSKRVILEAVTAPWRLRLRTR